jgi:hypothetical protein
MHVVGIRFETDRKSSSYEIYFVSLNKEGEHNVLTNVWHVLANLYMGTFAV